MTGPASRRLLLRAVLIAAVALLYGRTLTFDFVNYDDYDLVANNTEFLGHPGNILTSFTTHAFTSHRAEGVYYRPVLLLTYFADYFIWGLNPAGYHLTNVLMHLLATLLLFSLVREILRQSGGEGGSAAADGGNEFTAFTAAMIFAVHPVQTESVGWVAGRNDVLLGLFLIASFLCYVLQYRESRRQVLMFPSSALLFAAALFTKESAIFFFPLFPLYELTVRRESPETLFSGARHLRTSVYLAISLAYLGVRYHIFGAFIGAEALYGKIPFDNRLLMAPGLALTSMLFLVWPAGLSITHPLEIVPWFDWPLILVAVAAAAGLLGVWAFSIRRRPVLSWSAAWVIVGLVPLVNVFPLAVPILEHRLYIVTAGFALAVALAISPPSRPAIPRKVSTAVVVLVCLILSGLTWARLPVWRNSETLWLDAIEKTPEGARAYFNLAGYYFELGETDRVIPLLEKYVQLRPDDFMGYSKLRQCYFLAGRVRDAAAVCRKLIDMNPGNVGRYLEAGVLFERLGISDSVIAVYEEGLRYDPSFYQLRNRLGMWYAKIGDTLKSRTELAAADSVARAIGAPGAR